MPTSMNCPNGFNPRSPLPGSDAVCVCFTQYNVVRFQSTLPVAGERCRAGNTPALRSSCFNPRSPLPGSDAAAPLDLYSRTLWFQSTLPVAGERCAPARCNWRRVLPFQSTLPVAGERCRKNAAQFATARDVSIHAPRCRGAMPLPHTAPAYDEVTFQSTLPVAGERCQWQNCSRGQNDAVSIHAPRCRGAMPADLSGRPRLTASFNPRSPLPGSDASRHRRVVRPPRRFNPRSPLPGSDAHPACVFPS